ncbi:MAG TPA: 6-phosphofructokinase, partial [Candidatus Krumholzibacteria bacterium]|nr:6-phosphofructokinase [Candidatus Krumholzibacteria bacterium]
MSKRLRRIAILTGGGDVPGLNSVIKQVVYRAKREGIEVYGFRRGWGGLAAYRIDADPNQNAQHVIPLHWNVVRTI